MPGQAWSERDHHIIADGQHRISTLIKLLQDLKVQSEIDKPADPDGEWWIDLSFGDFSTNVAWRPNLGFGIFVSDSGGYGDRPDEIYREPERAAKRLRQLVARTAKDNAAMHLGELRRLLNRPQTDIAKTLKRDQAFVSRLERQDDALLSTVRDYVEALGGEVRLIVRFEGFEASVSLPAKTGSVDPPLPLGSKSFAATTNAIIRGLDGAKPESGARLIEKWETALADVEISGAKGIQRDLAALKRQVESDRPNTDRIRALLHRLGEATVKISDRAGKNGEKLKALGEALIADGKFYSDEGNSRDATVSPENTSPANQLKKATG